MASSAFSAFAVDFDPLSDLRHLEARAASDLADWLAFLEVEGKADRTLYAYMRYVARLLVMYPELAFDEFTDTHIERYLALIPRRGRHIPRSIIGKWFEWGELKRRIPRGENPMDFVAKVPLPRHRPRDIYTEAEVAVLENLPSPDGQLFALLFGSGLRRAEARRCQLEHVDQERQRLVILNGKGGKDAIVPLLTSAAVAINDLAILEGVNRSNYLWYSKQGGRRIDRSRPIGNTTFSHWYERCIKAAGVRYLPPHTTRHTYGHILREFGFDLEERQLLMRHESTRTTQKYYGTLTIEDVATKMRALA